MIRNVVYWYTARCTYAETSYIYQEPKSLADMNG